MILLYKEQIHGLHFVIIINDNPFNIIDYICVEMSSEEEIHRFVEKAKACDYTYPFEKLGELAMPNPEILQSMNRQERRHHAAFDSTRYKRKRKGDKYYK